MSNFLGIGAAITITLAMVMPTEALAQDPPQPTAPSPSPSPRVLIPRDQNQLPRVIRDRSDDGEVIAPAHSGFDWRKPNSGYFQREFESRQLLSAMGQSQNAVPIWIYSQIAAACIHRNAGEKTAELIGGKPVGDDRYEKLVEGLERPYRSCMSNEVAMLPRETINAALMERLMLEDTAKMRIGIGSASAREAQDFIRGDGKVDVYAIGRCVSILAPSEAMALLATEPDSHDEKAAFGKLYAAAPSCGLKEAPEALEPLMQRTAVAGGLYYWGARRYGTVTVGEEE